MPKIIDKKPVTERLVIYPEVEVRKCVGEEALTAEVCKQLLGWSNNPLQGKPDEPHLLLDMNGNKVWCHNNVTLDYTNRPLTWGTVSGLKQEHLRRKWRFNGETIIIGKYGSTLNGQHQMIALILAVQEWEKYPEDWDTWKTEPTMEKIVVFGVSEDDATVNTMDTCKPRTLAEVLYRSEIFAKLKVKSRKDCAKILEHAIRLLWHRLGISLDAFAPRRTHAEALDFIVRHPTLLKCVRHVFDENGDGEISKVISPGYAAALMYLMATSGSRPEAYHTADSFDEKNADLSQYKTAEKFFVDISSNAAEVTLLKNASLQLIANGRDSLNEKLAVVIKGWSLYVAKKKITVEALKLIYSEDDVPKLAECPTTGGIDRGNPRDDLHADEPTEEEKQEHKAAEESIRATKDKAASNGKPAKGKKSQKIEVGDIVWVKEDTGAWDGELVEIYETQGKSVGRVKSAGSGKIFDAPIAAMTHTEPN